MNLVQVPSSFKSRVIHIKYVLKYLVFMMVEVKYM